MKFTRLKSTVAFLLSFLGIQEIPLDAEGNKVSFSEDQESKLKTQLGQEKFDDLIKAFNKELDAIKKGENLELKKMQDEIDALIKEAAQDSNMSQEEIKEIVAKENNGSKTPEANLEASINSLKSLLKEKNQLIQKLMSDELPDVKTLINTATNGKVKHSETHLFSTGKDWDAFENRPWNQRMKDLSAKQSDFNKKTDIPLLQDDLEHFVRENPAVLESLYDDFLGLPADWNRESGVLDRKANAAIIAGEIVQGRANNWAPKNKFHIDTEEGRVYRKKIDITFKGYELQEIENTWIRSYNKEGSHPWKMSFVGFLLGELIKQQALDDRNAQINGVFVRTPDVDGLPGAAVNSQNGLLYLFWLYRDVYKKYRPFVSSFGEPTKANIVDYVKEMIEFIPEVNRRDSGLELGITEEMMGWYRETAGEEYKLMYYTDQGNKEYKMNHPIDYPNIKFQPIRDMVKTRFMYITKSKNISILDYRVDEKSKFTFDMDKRDINIFADYRLGIMLNFVGTKTKEGDLFQYEKQMVWSNDVPIFDKHFAAPLFNENFETLNYKEYNGFNHYKVNDNFDKNIEEISGFPVGTVLRITGNTKMANERNVVDSTDVILSGGNFNLKLGGTLTLFVRPDNKLIELARTTAPEGVPSSDVDYTTAAIDANDGVVFRFDGNAALTVNNIINGVEGKIIKIYGGAGGAVTINSVAGVISLTGAAVLADGADFLELIKVNGVWIEISRTIA